MTALVGTRVTAPFVGVVTPLVEVGERVAAGQAVASIESMKMEATITAPCAGVVDRVAVRAGDQVEGGGPILVLAP